MRHHRVTAAGMAMGQNATRLAALGQQRLESQSLTKLGLAGMRDDMCKTCACQPNTVPNGCLQTQLDFLKAVIEGGRFICHSPKDGRLCAGWVRARAEVVANPLPKEAVEIVTKWEYSPPDDDDASSVKEAA